LYNPDETNRECDHFISQDQNQRFFEAAGSGDSNRLDTDKDGSAEDPSGLTVSIEGILRVLGPLVLGGLAGTIVSLWFQSRWRKESRALQLTQFYLENQEWFSDAKALLERSEQLENEQENRVSRAGDFWDYVALMYTERMADTETLESLSVPRLISNFYRRAEQSSSLSNITPSEDWKHMKKIADKA
jgi:hypothetical protein